MVGLINKRAIVQVLGCLLNKPDLLDTYYIEEIDVDEDFYVYILNTIKVLHKQNVPVIDAFAIDSYLSSYDAQYKIFSMNNGVDYIENAKKIAVLENFEYNYKTLKKFTLLRYYDYKGTDIKFIYDPTKLNPEDQERETRKLDEYTVDEIIELVELEMVTKPKLHFNTVQSEQGQLAGSGLKELKEKWKQEPEFGISLQSPTMNTIARGARLKKFYLRSGGTASGKTRMAVGDVCTYSVPWFYDTFECEWKFTGFSEPALFISTELEADEIQSMIIAFVSGVNESKILDGKYSGDEEERVDKAIQFIESAPLYIEHIDDFDINDIENLIKRYKKEKGVLYVSFDYIHTSVKLIMQIASMSKGMKLQEHQILYMFAIKLKELCNKLGVHIDSSTQLNGEYKNARDKDETLLRGAKSIADKIDIGIISMPPTREELKAVEPILEDRGVTMNPNLIYHIYKVRRGKISRVRLWLHADLGTCRSYDLFVTNNDNELIPVEQITIENVEQVLEDNSVEHDDIPLNEEEHDEAIKQFFF